MRAKWSWLTGLALVLASPLVSPLPTGAAVLDPAFTQSTFVTSGDLAEATGLAWAPDGSNRLFVTIKTGAIRIIKDGALLPAPFATVSPLYAGSECGLVGIAFDPNFLANRYVYVFATVSASEQQIIRYIVDGDTGIGKTTVVAGLPTVGANHDGGGIGLGPDGKLYWAIGDLGNGTGVNTDLASLASKVGRANLDGTVPLDNPYVDGSGPNADLIWARGFRNPFTLTFQPATGLLWINDVGAGYEQIFVVRKGEHAGWNMYEANQPTGFILPVIKYRTNGTDTLNIAASSTDPSMAGAARAGGMVTFATASEHRFRPGEKITVSGVADTSFNGNHFVASVPSANTFRVAQVGPDALSGGGTADTQAIGGCVTGGAFYDSTGAPTVFRGNFFFGDFNTGRIERVTLDPGSNTVTSVDHWADGLSYPTDLALGPDGALYYVGTHTFAVFRAAYNASAQGLVISPTNLWIAEGDPAVVMVRLATMPAQDTAVTLSTVSPSGAARVLNSSPLTFTPASWDKPQMVTVYGVRDVDATDAVEAVSVTSPGLPAESFRVHVRDDNRVNLQISTTALSLAEGSNGTFTVALTERPSRDVPVSVARTAGDQDVTVAAGTSLTFTRANWSTAQTVTLTGGSDLDGADDGATIEVSMEGRMPRTVAVTVDDDDPPLPDAGPDAAPDAGARDAAVVDASAGSDTRRIDASAVPVGTGGGGCGCRTGDDRASAPAAAALLLLVVALRARRRRR
jgi:MYXO-CTERM domain-containing protein